MDWILAIRIHKCAALASNIKPSLHGEFACLMSGDRADQDSTAIPALAEGASAVNVRATADENSKTQTFPIVCVGSSAGGLKAFSSLLAELRPDIGMAFILMQHLDPNQKSLLSSLLAKVSRLPIEEVVDGSMVKANRVYVVTPNTRIRIAQGILHVAPRGNGSASIHSIDALLCSLAKDRPDRAIGVILSGTGTDGTLGLAAIKAAGGVTFAQDTTAEYTGMPESAIGHGHVDFVLPPNEIAKELRKIAQFGFPAKLPKPKPEESHVPEVEPPDADPIPVDPEHYATIITKLRATTGIDFTHYRSTTILRRTMRRMALISKSSLAEYAHYLTDVPEEVDALARDILINVTSFFRDPDAFARLKADAFPTFMKDREAGSPIRMWVVGCSTGQEVYSLAIELAEYLRISKADNQRVQIFASDISDWALAKARLGCYSEKVADEIPPDQLARYFTKSASGYSVNKSIRDLCVFAKHDITADTPFSRLDLITCRNVLIYLGPVLQKHVLPTFHFAMKPGGFLLLGTSETVGRSSPLFETIDEKFRLYRSIPAPRRYTQQPIQLQRTGNPGMPLPPQQSVQSLSEMQRAADQIVLGRFAPAGVLVTETMEIVQFRGHTNPYLEPAQGEANLNLTTMVPFGVADALRKALDEAKKNNLPVRRERIAHSRAHSFREIAFEVIPIRMPTGITCFLILFEEQDAAAQAEKGVSPAAKNTAASTANTSDESGSRIDKRVVTQLRTELTAATDYVRSLVELNHTQAEQLKEAQEEAQASVEEFRSTNEELQTTKEEIESTNEELVTINEELRAANADLAKASAALRASGELTSAIVETMRYPMLVLAPNLSVESANQAFLDMFGVKKNETIGRLVYDLGNGQWNIPELRRLLEDVLPNHSAFDDFEVTHDFRNIGRKTMLLNARRLQGSEDTSRLIVLVIADITEQARATNEMKEASHDQLRSNAELDQFAAVASHDLQEPLRMVSSFISLLDSRYGSLFDDRARGYMSQVTRGAQRMKEMIEAILTYSRLGHEATVVTNIDSTVAYTNAIENLRIKIDEAQATVEAEGLPQVVASQVQLTQMFQNLIGNALKFRSDQRPPMIRVGCKRSGNEWIFSVADNGMGLEESDFERIFQLFQRVHTKHQLRGSGIGLATCKRIVEHHKGRIWVESKVDAGSTFFFTLPA